MGAREPDDFDPLAGAEVVVRGRFENQRIAVVPMEGAAVAVVPGDDGDGHELTVYLALPDAALQPRRARQRLRHRARRRCG